MQWLNQIKHVFFVQKAVTGQFRKQVEEIFGKHFGSLFESQSSKSTELAAPQQSENSSPASEVAKPTEEVAKQPEAPKTPNFCTLIVWLSD